MPVPRSIRHLWLLGAAVLGAIPVACRLDMLLKPTAIPRPVLVVSPAEVRDTALSRSNQVRRTDVALTNGGGGEITWSASDRSAWIRLEPREGAVPSTLTISLDPEDLGPGIYESEVTVIARGAADSETVAIPVTFVVQRPGLNVSPTSIQRSTNVGSGEVFSESVQISNSGTGELRWTASEDKSWLSLSATAGTGESTLGVTISSAGLSGGTYTAEIVISAPGALGSPQRVTVTLTVLAPGLAVTPGSISETDAAGSTTPKTRTLRVTNSGNGSLTWSATKTQPWVTLSQTTGGAPEDVIVTLNPTGLPPGVQRDTIVFTSPQATNGAVHVPVSYEITQPGLVVSPSAINATAARSDDQKQQFDLAISNSGGGTLAWFASADAPWIAVSPLGGLAPATLKVTIDPKGLSAGTHTGSVTVSSPGAAGSPAVVPVQLVITQRPCNEISVSPDVVRAGTLDLNDCEAPHRPGSLANLYSFSVNAGDTISIRMTAQFDAYLILTDAAGTVLAQNDECPGESGTACITSYGITSGGKYLVEATSTNPGAQGQLTFTLKRERAASAPQDLRQLRSDGNTQIGVGETIPETEVVFRGKVNDPNQTDEVRFEVELRALGTPFSNAATHLSDFVAGGTTTAIRASGLPAGTGYHWQARACDTTGRCSAWVAFGNNADSDADFAVAPPPGTAPHEE
jgi:hypothetical protein